VANETVVDEVIEVPASAAEVWRRITTPEGINHELMPIMPMTVPAGLRGFSADDAHRIVPGTAVGRSYLLLLGFLPFDYDNITIAELEPERRFVEQSTMLSMRRWQHERTITPRGKTCELRDTMSFRLRVPGPEALVARMLRAILRHRHRRLVKYFNERA
jgi:ligand-binding SRPBCC domain-containing protein